MNWSYKRAVEFIALNDEPDDLYINSISNYLSTATLAIASGKKEEVVAQDIYNFRIKEISKREKEDKNLHLE
jgi:hypothetical protein